MTRREEHDLTDKDEDEMAQLIADRLFECEQCERPNVGTQAALEKKWIDGRLRIRAAFTCPECGWQNRNTAYLGP